ncbi:hypothetical protein MOE20_15520 [Bacillus atrophaeus]|uniref:hypothetical protein n=1 Tax=Bacillus atrophaeus TaxID=1452 RepID=UPI002280ABBC|nr:hypothetical protein [Bacillus atrophaeus]MCY8918449.1 hypothetical protein [Bacillus atrophaeus]MCY8925992.1 hypothetical protein [Bacillus atrophaeus]
MKKRGEKGAETGGKRAILNRKSENGGFNIDALPITERADTDYVPFAKGFRLP